MPWSGSADKQREGLSDSLKLLSAPICLQTFTQAHILLQTGLAINLYSLIIQLINNYLLRGCSDRERFVISWDFQRGDAVKQLEGRCSQVSGDTDCK